MELKGGNRRLTDRFTPVNMSEGQGDDGDASIPSHASQLSDPFLPGGTSTQGAGEGNAIQEPNSEESTQELTEHADESIPGFDDYDDGNSNDNGDDDGQPERPSSRLDLSFDDEGDPITPEDNNDRTSRLRLAASPALSRISERSSNETGTSANVVDTGEGAAMPPVSGRGSMDNESSDSDADSTQNDETMEATVRARGHLFDNILIRIRDEHLFTHIETLLSAELAASMLGQEAPRWWNAGDLRASSLRTIEHFRQAMQRPRDDGTVLTVEVQNQITEQLQALAFVLQRDAVGWLFRGLRTDTRWLMKITSSIAHLLADRPAPAPALQSRATSMASNSSRPERVFTLHDPERLRKMGHDELVRLIIKHSDERRTEADQYEADLGDLQEAKDRADTGRKEAEASLDQLVTVTQQLREVAFQNGKNGLHIDGGPLQVEGTRSGPNHCVDDELEKQERYINRIEAQLNDCLAAQEKDQDTLKHLRYEITDLNSNLATARDDARHERLQAYENGRAGLNIEGTEAVEPLPRQEVPPPPVSERSSSQPTTSGEVLRDLDAELEALRTEHQQELAQSRTDFAKDLHDLRKDNAEDRLQAWENGRNGLAIDGRLLSGQHFSDGSLGQAAEHRESSHVHLSDNDLSRAVAPGLGDLLDSFWADDHETADFVAAVDQQYHRQQQEQSGQTEPDPASEPAARLSSSQQRSQSDSAQLPISSTAANEEAQLEDRINDLVTTNHALERRVNSLIQITKGTNERNRVLEVARNNLQNQLQEAISRQEAWQEQVAELEQARDALKQALAGNTEALQQHYHVELQGVQSALRPLLASSPTGQNADEESHATAPPATEAMQQQIRDLEATNKVLQDTPAIERADNVDEGSTSLQMAAGHEVAEQQALQARNNSLARENDALGQTIATTRRERDDARAELISLKNDLEKSEKMLQTTIDHRDDAQQQVTNAANAMQQNMPTTEAERDQENAALQEAQIILQEQKAITQRAIEDARTALDERHASQLLVVDLQWQLKECQEHRVTEGPTLVAGHPEQAVDLVERLLQVINRLRSFAPHANEAAQFANAMVQAGHRNPVTMEAELQLIENSAMNVVWPDADFEITPTQREDIGQLAAALEAWLPTVESAIDESVLLSAAVGSMRVVVEIWNLIDPPKRAGSEARLAADLASNTSTTSSISIRQMGELLNLTAQIADQYTREKHSDPIDEARKLNAASATADLYLRKLMRELPDPDDEDEVGMETAGGSGGGFDGGNLDHSKPIYTDPAWLRIHSTGPCDQCEPVRRLPTALFPMGVDPGPCTCGLSDTVDPYIAKSRSSRKSGVRNVAFSNDHNAADGGTATKPPRGILKKPQSLDTTGVKTGGSGGQPKSPYPQRARSIHGWSATQLLYPRQPQRARSTPSSGIVAGSSLPSQQLSHDISVPIIPVQKFCCKHFDKLRRVCTCGGKCEDHWCCEHWHLTGRCMCNKACHTRCCIHWQQSSNDCNRSESRVTHTQKKCCLCGFKPGVVPNECACDNTCRDHAVCEHFRTFKPRNLSCMAGCDAFEKDQKCEHGGVCRQTPCDAHACCQHHVLEDGWAYCRCGKTCALHVCCPHYLPGFKTCECGGTCENHLPVIPDHLRQHFRGVAAVAQAQTTPGALVTNLYHPGGKMFPRQDGQPYDWDKAARANMDLLKTHNLLGPNGAIILPMSAVAQSLTISSTAQRVNVSSTGRHVRSPASQMALAIASTLMAPAAPPGAAQAAVRRRPDFPVPIQALRRLPRRQQGEGIGRDSLDVQDVQIGASARVIPSKQPVSRNNALPDLPQPEPGRLLSDGLLNFNGPLPDFGNTEENSKQPPISAQCAACAHGQAACVCSCRCRGAAYHVLTGPGGSFAFYTCRRMHQENSAQPAVRADEENAGDTMASTGAADGASHLASFSGSDGPQGHSSGAHSRRGSRQHSRRGGANLGPSGHIGAGPDDQQQGDQQPRAQDLPGQAPVDTEPDHDGRDHGGSGGDDPYNNGGRGGGGGNRARRPNREAPPNPWRQIWDFIWLLIRFFTFGQIANLVSILGFVRDVALCNFQQILHLSHIAQRWQRMPNARLPQAELLSFLLWLLLMWQLTMMIALGEERRLWLAANPRTATYMRGLQFRNPYPRWSPFEVDYALLEPALGGLSVSLHRLYFKPGVLDRLEDTMGAVVGVGQSLLQMERYSTIFVGGAVVQVKDIVLRAVPAVVAFPLGIVAAVWALFVKMVTSRAGAPLVQPNNPGNPVPPPNMADPQVVYGGVAWWEVWWGAFWDLLVRTVTGRRRVSHE